MNLDIEIIFRVNIKKDEKHTALNNYDLYT